LKATYVVDANVAVSWTVELPYTSLAKTLLGSSGSLIAPDFIVVEVANAFHVLNKSGVANRERLKDGLDLLPRWFSELCPASQLRSRAFELATELNHPAYDCFYLALALLRDVKLVTSDAHFLRKVVASGYQKSVSSLEEWAKDERP
jgi:predicted nucleic acid-binding protein